MALNMTLGTSQSTQEVKKWVMDGFNYKLGSAYGQNTPKIGYRTQFFRYHRPCSRASKPSKYPYYFKYDLKYITEYRTGKKNGFQKVLDTN